MSVLSACCVLYAVYVCSRVNRADWRPFGVRSALLWRCCGVVVALLWRCCGVVVAELGLHRPDRVHADGQAAEQALVLGVCILGFGFGLIDWIFGHFSIYPVLIGPMTCALLFLGARASREQIIIKSQKWLLALR